MPAQNLNEAYQNFYNNSNKEWRMLGASAKARNIVDVCKTLNPEKVLEVGAGDGSVLYYLNQLNFGKSLYALEIAESGLARIRELQLDNLQEALLFDGYKIPYEDDSFDLVVLSHVLEHVEHERILIRELKRVARHIVIEVPLDYRYGVDKRIKHFLDYGHINMYTPTIIRFLLSSEGLMIEKDKTSMTPVATVKFWTFNLKNKPSSLLKTVRIELEYHIKHTLGLLLGKKKREQFGNAYTVLTRKTDHTLKIF